MDGGRDLLWGVARRRGEVSHDWCGCEVSRFRVEYGMMFNSEASQMTTVNIALPNAIQPAEPWLITEQKVRAVVERIVSIARPQKVVVFGSYARGQAKPGSDLDILVIMDDTLANSRAESVRLRRALRGIFMPIDIVVARSSDVERLRHTPGLLYETALSEGRVMYERE
jgi:uncharacterized protein